MNPSRSDVEQTGPVCINATQKSAKSAKSTIGSPGSGSPPLPSGEDAEAAANRPPVGRSTSHGEDAHRGQPGHAQTTRATPGNMRSASASGGMHVVLDEAGSWSDLADKSPSAANAKGKPSGMLGFLSKRRGRAASPKPQERGVLGREGARHIIA